MDQVQLVPVLFCRPVLRVLYLTGEVVQGRRLREERSEHEGESKEDHQRAHCHRVLRRQDLHHRALHLIGEGERDRHLREERNLRNANFFLSLLSSFSLL